MAPSWWHSTDRSSITHSATPTAQVPLPQAFIESKPPSQSSHRGKEKPVPAPQPCPGWRGPCSTASLLQGKRGRAEQREKRGRQREGQCKSARESQHSSTVSTNPPSPFISMWEKPSSKRPFSAWPRLVYVLRGNTEPLPPPRQGWKGPRLTNPPMGQPRAHSCTSSSVHQPSIHPSAP